MVVEKAMRAGDLPESLRAGMAPQAMVLVSVRPLTENGFTEEFEHGVLAAETETEAAPFRPAQQVINELKALIAEDESSSPQ